MTQPNDAAFPEQPGRRDRETEEWLAGLNGGLTKREYFAAMAMRGFTELARNPEAYEHIAARSAAMADALIAELNKKPAAS